MLNPARMPLDLDRALGDPGFTPGARQLPELFARLEAAEEDQVEALVRVLARAGDSALTVARERLGAAEARLRVRLVRLVQRCEEGKERSMLLRQALADRDPLVARWAARGLGRGQEHDADSERALLEAYEKDDLPLRRAIVEALGKIGDRESMPLLERARAADDAELRRRAEKARLLLGRRSERRQPSRILLDVALPRAVTVVGRTRAGLAEFAASELQALAPLRVTSPSSVELEHAGSLRALLRARTVLEFGIFLRSGSSAPAPQAVAEAVTRPEVIELLRAWTEGPLRFRLSFGAAGHRRRDVWQAAERVAECGAGLINDSRDAPWEFHVGERLDQDGVLLVPRAFDDPRFAYRTRDVPAASHPTIAAALALAAGVRQGDVVWDPFTGSGLELVERALLGPYQRLIGSDLDPRALDAARVNLAAARVERFELACESALEFAPPDVSLIISNPPMGRRVARDGSLKALLSDFVVHAARVLVPGGRLVWLSPLPELTQRAAQASGLSVRRHATVDLGGFSAELQVADKLRR